MGSGNRSIEDNIKLITEILEYLKEEGKLSKVEVEIAKKAITDGENSMSEKQKFLYGKNAKSFLKEAGSMTCDEKHKLALDEVVDYLRKGCPYCAKNPVS